MQNIAVLTSMAPIDTFNLRFCEQSFSQCGFVAVHTCAMDGMFPAPNAAALPGSRAKQRQKARSHVPLGRANDDIARWRLVSVLLWRDTTV